MHQVQEHTQIKSDWEILVEVWRCEKWQREEAGEARELGEGTEGPALPSSKPRSLKNQSRLRLEGPRAALSNQWKGERVRVGVGGWRPGNA